MASESSTQIRSFWNYFAVALIFCALVVSIVVTYKTYIDDGTNHQPVASMQDFVYSQDIEAAPLHAGPVVRADAVDYYEMRLKKLEDQIIETQDASTNHSKQLEIWLGQTQNAYEARFEQIEQHMVSGLETNDVTKTNVSIPPLDAYEDRLKQLVIWINKDRGLYETRFAEIEEVLYKNQETIKNIFKQMELRDSRENDPYGGRLRNVEQQLNRDAEEFKTELQKIEKHLSDTASRLDSLSSAIVAQAEHKDTIAVINDETEQPHQPHITLAPLSLPSLQTSGNPPGVYNPPNGQSYTSEGQVPPLSANSGSWVINLASYTSRSIAARKMTEFQNNGVQAQLASANVRGEIMYRLQVVGFESFTAAKLAAPTIRQRLNLNDTWIDKI